MKNAFRTVKKSVKAIWNDESAQGATEYILLLVVVVSVAMMFRTKIKEFVGGRLTALGSGMNTFNPEE